MKLVCFFLLFQFTALLLSHSAFGSSVPDSLIRRWESGLRGQMRKYGIPGLSVALVDREGIVWSRGFGLRGGRCSGPIGGNTLFSVQSVSKAITATAVMLAVQERLVDLDAPITRYLPDFTVNSCFEEHPEDRITLRLLLAHASGLTHEPSVGNNFACSFSSQQAHNLSIRETWLNSPVGTRYSYSNCGYDLAAEVVARASGVSFDKYVSARLFAPLGMAFSTLDADSFMGNVNRAKGHSFGLVKLPEAIPFPGAGCLYSSAEDLAKFVKLHLNLGRIGRKQLLEPGYLYEMYRPIITPEYGLGLAVIDRDGELVFNHNGGGFGWAASMTWFPQYGVGCVILANKQTGADLYGLTVKFLDDWVSGSAICPDTRFLPFDPVWIGRSLSPVPEKAPWCGGDTLFQPKWRAYEGVYRLAYGPGFVFTWYAKLAMALGYNVPQVEVSHGGSSLYIRINNGSGFGCRQSLAEYQPGLFFTEYGEAVDFRKHPPTYRNITLKR